MKTIIVGTGNLSSELRRKTIGDMIVLSARQIVKDKSILKSLLDSDEVFNFIFNCFHTSAKLYGCPLNSLVENSISNLSVIISVIEESCCCINKVIYSSSSSVYGIASTNACSEVTPVSPNSLYATLKLACEQLIKEFCSSKGVDYTITRIFNMYGGDDKFSIINKIINAAVYKFPLTIINNGLGVRDFIHVNDVADIYFKLLVVKNVPIINIGSGVGVSISELINRIEKEGVFLSLKHKSNPNEIHKSVANIKLLRTLFVEKDFRAVRDDLHNSIKKVVSKSYG